MDFNPMIPIWTQVVTRLKNDIVTGQLSPGAKLPGSRELAVQYGINPNTAARVYQEMEREGLCATRRGLGTFVTSDTARIADLRREMARTALQQFLSAWRGLGLTAQEAAAMILEEENHHA